MPICVLAAHPAMALLKTCVIGVSLTLLVLEVLTLVSAVDLVHSRLLDSLSALRVLLSAPPAPTLFPAPLAVLAINLFKIIVQYAQLRHIPKEDLRVIIAQKDVSHLQELQHAKPVKLDVEFARILHRV